MQLMWMHSFSGLSSWQKIHKVGFLLFSVCFFEKMTVDYCNFMLCRSGLAERAEKLKKRQESQLQIWKHQQRSKTLRSAYTVTLSSLTNVLYGIYEGKSLASNIVYWLKSHTVKDLSLSVGSTIHIYPPW